MRSTPPFHLTHLIHLIDKPCSNAASFRCGLSVNESRESSETAMAQNLILDGSPGAPHLQARRRFAGDPRRKGAAGR